MADRMRSEGILTINVRIDTANADGRAKNDKYSNDEGSNESVIILKYI